MTDDDGGDGVNSRIETWLPEPSTLRNVAGYAVRVRDFFGNPATFKASLTRLPDPPEAAEATAPEGSGTNR